MPILRQYGDEYCYVTWDYRGLFSSALPNQPRLLSVPAHARDGMEVLRAAGFDHADVVVGHSMGVPVALEMALLFPEAVGSLVLMNGFHGQCFQTAFQPLVRIPFMGDATALLVRAALDRADVHTVSTLPSRLPCMSRAHASSLCNLSP